jgi:hypothetical protein
MAPAKLKRRLATIASHMTTSKSVDYFKGYWNLKTE